MTRFEFEAGGRLLALWLVVLAVLVLLVATRWMRDRRARSREADEELLRSRLLDVASGRTPPRELALPPARQWYVRARRLLQATALLEKWGGVAGDRARAALEGPEPGDLARRYLARSRGRRQRLGAEYFARVPDPQAQSDLIRALRDGDRKVRVAAAYGLTGEPSQEAARALLDALSGPRGIGRVFGSDVATRMGPAVADVILAGLSSEDPSVRMVAADAVGQWRMREAVPKLESLVVERRREGDVAIRALYALGVIGESRSVPVVAGCLSPENSPPVRHAAAAALGHLDDPAARGVLSSFLDQDPDLARLAAEALARSEEGRALLRRQSSVPGQRGRVAAWGLWTSDQLTSPLSDLPLSDVTYRPVREPHGPDRRSDRGKPR